MLKGAPIFAIGPLVRDIVFIHNRERRQKLLVGSRGGGSLWNAQANAAYLGAPCHAICVAGSDLAAKEGLDDLRLLGVELLDQHLKAGRRTRTLHEILELPAPASHAPSHKFVSRCPVCANETYRKGSVRLTNKIIRQAEHYLLGGDNTVGIMHTDGLDKTRFGLAEKLKASGWLISLDLGRSTGLYRMRDTNILDRLREVDLLFLHQRVESEILRMAGADSLSTLVERLKLRSAVVTKGERGATFAFLTDSGHAVSAEQPAKTPETILDTSGAGDALIGSVLSQISKNSNSGEVWFPQSSDEFLQVLGRAQRVAADKCKFIGARGHIAGLGGSSWSWERIQHSLVEGKSVDDLMVANLSRKTCVSCESLLVDQLQQSVSTFRLRYNIVSLPAQIEMGWKVRRFSPWKTLTELNGPGYVIGTGGSFSAATFLALLLSTQGRGMARAVRPFDYIRMGNVSPYVIVLSHSGKTLDIAQALKVAKQRGVKRRVLVSGAEKPDLAKYLDGTGDVVIVAGNGEPEHGFLSFSGVALPMFLSWAVFRRHIWEKEEGFQVFHEIFSESKNKASAAAHMADKLAAGPQWTDRKIIALGGGFGWPAIRDFESKMVEGNLGHVEISEMKDYSHGRFMSSIEGSCTAIVFGLPDDLPYRNFLIDRIRRKNIVIDLSTTREGGEGGLDLLLSELHLVNLIAERKGYDAAKPNVPRVGLELYRYKSLLDYGEDS